VCTLYMHRSLLGALVLLSTSMLIIFIFTFIFTLIAILNFSFPYVGRVVSFLFTKNAAVFVYV
jgi:hypothetical protein